MTWSSKGTVLPTAGEHVPEWLTPLINVAGTVDAADITRFVPSHGQGRHSAVLLLFGNPERDLLMIERAHTLRSHAGQPAFPGGAVDDSDEDAVAAALREAQEETGLDPAGVAPLALLPDLWVPVSDFVVTPVIAWWRNPSPVFAAAPAEVASVHRIPIAELVDPANRCRVRHPSGFVGPGFQVDGLLVWGFTAGLIDAVLRLASWEVPWDDTVVVELDSP